MSPSAPPRNQIVYFWMSPLCISRIAPDAETVPLPSRFMNPSTTWRSNHAIGVEMHAKIIL